MASAEVIDRDGSICAKAMMESVEVIDRDGNAGGGGIVQVVGGGGCPPTWEEVHRKVPMLVREIP